MTKNIDAIVAIILSLLTLILIFFTFTKAKKSRFRGKLPRFFFHTNLGKGILLLVSLWILSSSLTYISECHFCKEDEFNSSPFRTLPRSLVGMLYPATVFYGMEQGTPSSFMGQLIAAFASLGYLIVGTVFVGAALLDKLRQSWRKKMKINWENHFVVCGWNENMEKILSQLTNPALGDEKRPVAVLVREEEVEDVQNIVERLGAQQQIKTVSGSLVSENDLTNVGVQNAQGVLILPPAGDNNPELAVLFCALSIKKMRDETGKNLPQIIAYTEQANFADKLSHIADTIITPTETDILLSATALLCPDTVEIYRRLMTVSEETNEIYLVKAPEPWTEKKLSFRELAEVITRKSRKESPVILIGLKRNEKIYINPKDDETGHIKEGDKLIVIAMNYPRRILEDIAAGD